MIADLVSDDWDAGDLERAVIREVARIETDEKRAVVVEALAAEGVAVVEDWNRWGGGARQPVALGSGHGELPIDPAKHGSEPCHAAHVTRGGEVTYLCTEPTRHRPEGKSKVQAPKGSGPTRNEQQAAEREAARQRRAVDRERAEFTASLAKRRLPKPDVTAIVLGQFLAAASNAQAKAGCALLGIDAGVDDFGAAHRTALIAHAESSAANRERAALALALAIGEDTVRLGDTDGRTQTGRLHLDFLAAYGWGEAVADDPGDADRDPAYETADPNEEEPFPA